MCTLLRIPDFDVAAAFEGIVKHGIFDYYQRCHVLALDDALLLDARSVHDEVVSMTADFFNHTAHLRGETSIFLERTVHLVAGTCHTNRVSRDSQNGPVSED